MLAKRLEDVAPDANFRTTKHTRNKHVSDTARGNHGADAADGEVSTGGRFRAGKPSRGKGRKAGGSAKRGRSKGSCRKPPRGSGLSKGNNGKVRINWAFVQQIEEEEYVEKDLVIPPFRPPVSDQVVEANKEAFLKSLTHYQCIKADNEEEARLEDEKKVFLSTAQFDVTKSYQLESSVLEKKYDCENFHGCPYCKGNLDKKNITWCPFHLKQMPKQPSLPAYAPMLGIVPPKPGEGDRKLLKKIAKDEELLIGLDEDDDMKPIESNFMSLSDFRKTLG